MIDTGEYLFNLERGAELVGSELGQMYQMRQPHISEHIVDFHISLERPGLIRRFLRPQVTFCCDRSPAFKPVSKRQAFATLEWGMNWCIAAFDHSRLIIHAAVVRNDDVTVMLPASPGSGKSTLSAYLAMSNWQLFSDELAIIEPSNLQLSPMHRPICLKNQSIDLIHSWFPQAEITEPVLDTQKGTVAHLRPANWSTPAPAVPDFIVLPKFRPNQPLEITRLTKAEGFAEVHSHCFNYSTQGKRGFETLTRLINRTIQLQITYGDVGEVREYLEHQLETERAGHAP